MKERIINILCCPKCKSNLKIINRVIKDNEIYEGSLACENNHEFPIENFIPRLFLEKKINKSNDTKQVKACFGDKWKFLPTKTKDKKDVSWQGYNKVARKWIDQKYGYENKEKFKQLIENRKFILDAGCGLARESINFSKYNKKGEIFGLEFSDCVDEAYENTKKIENIHIIQGDVMNLPFKPKTFDYIFSEGVLHHTYSTKKAFEFLCDVLSKGGEIAIYVYRKKSDMREFTDDYIREKVKSLTFNECYKLCEPITKLGKTLSNLNIEFEVPEDIKLLNIKKGRYNLQRFIYYNILKCFWNNDMSYKENVLVAVDWFYPAYAWRQTPKDVRNWFKEKNIKIIHEDICNAGITIRGITNA